MKTININLIGSLGKSSKLTLKAANKKISSNMGNQVFALILIIAILITFAVSFGGWIAVKKMTASLDKNLINVEENIKTLEAEETKLNTFRKNLKKEKEMAKLKILVKSKVDSSFLPWSDILKEIAVKMPKDIIVLNIEKIGNPRDKESNLKISGIIPTNKKIKPLMAASIFIFSLNNDQNSLLSDAKISRLEFNEKTRAYEFEIETSIVKRK